MSRFTIICLLALISLSAAADEVPVQPINQGNGSDLTPTLDYDLATQEFTIDFGEVDEISGCRVVIHDDSDGYQVHKWIDKRPVCLYEQPRQHKTAQDGQQIRGFIK